MEVENIKGSAVMSYQGSAATPAVTEASSVSSAEQTQDSTTQMSNQTAQTSGYSGVDKNHPFGTEETEGSDEQKVNKGEQLKKAVADLNKQLPNSEAIFGIHEKTNRVTIKIVDKSTKEVIKEYPPEETLDMIAKVWEIAGILVDEKL